MNVRLPLELQEAIRKLALRGERSFSGQVRWLLQKALVDLYRNS
jgi:hypothetical protein